MTGLRMRRQRKSSRESETLLKGELIRETPMLIMLSRSCLNEDMLYCA